MDSQAKELTLRDLLTILQRRRSIVLGTVISLFVATAIYCLLCTRRYESTGTVQMQKESADAMGLDSLMSSASGGAGDALNANIDLQTQANILQSDTLALETIKSLGLESTQDFQRRRNPLTTVLDHLSADEVMEVPGTSLENSAVRRQHAIKVFSKNLGVKPLSGTRLIQITYMNPDPKLAAAVVNALTKELTDYSFQTRFDATREASRWLSDQMGDLRKTSEELQAKVVNLERQSGVYSLGGSDAEGRQMAYSGVLDRLQQATAALTAAEQNKILKGAIAHAAEGGDAEMLSGLAGNGMGPNAQAGNNSLSLLQSLRQQEATQQAALQEAEAKFGPAYPRLAEMRGNVAGIDKAIQQEIGRIKLRAKSDYVVAAQTATSTRDQYERAKREADVLNNKAIDYAIAKTEAEQSRALYDDLLKRLNEAGVLAGLHSSNITVVDPGRVPAKPVRPNIPLYLAGALCGGLLVGFCAALLADTLDNKVNTVTDLESEFGQPVLGLLPQVTDTAGRALILDDPQSPYVEALRAMRTGVLLCQSSAPPKTILVTSSLASEGKSTTSINLAIALAQTHKRTLLVDTDLRRGSLRSRFRLSHGSGLSDVLAGRHAEPDIHDIDDVPYLHVLPAGSRTPNPSELLSSEAMRACLERWRAEYDFVVLDSAPVLPVADAVALNTLVDVSLLLARSRMTEKPQIARSYNMLRRGGNHFVGLVLNGLAIGDKSYYAYYGYHDKTYAYREKVA